MHGPVRKNFALCTSFDTHRWEIWWQDIQSGKSALEHASMKSFAGSYLHCHTMMRCIIYLFQALRCRERTFIFTDMRRAHGEQTWLQHVREDKVLVILNHYLPPLLTCWAAGGVNVFFGAHSSVCQRAPGKIRTFNLTAAQRGIRT